MTRYQSAVCYFLVVMISVYLTTFVTRFSYKKCRSMEFCKQSPQVSENVRSKTYQNFTSQYEKRLTNALKKQKMMYGLKSCIIGLLNDSDGKKESTWVSFHIMIQECLRLHNFDNLTFLDLKTDKRFLPIRRSEGNNCTYVTLGIGGEIKPERIIKNHLYPSCYFYGADPIQNTAKVYREVGNFSVVAVNAVSLISRILHLKIPKATILGRYKK